MQMQRHSVDYSEASYCERETYEDWGSKSSLTKSFQDEITQSSTDDVPSLKAERDALLRALSAEKQRAASVARAQDARLAELHGVIAELMRRRTLDRQRTAIPEEDTDRSDECDSTTQPAGELDSKTEGNEASSVLSGADLPSSLRDGDEVSEEPQIRLSEATECDSNIEQGNELVEHRLSTNRLCMEVPASTKASSCEKLRGSITASPGHSEPVQARLASRIKLKRAADSIYSDHLSEELIRAAEKLSIEVCAAADDREAAVTENQSVAVWSARLAAMGASRSRLAADVRLLLCTLQRAGDVAHRLSTQCAKQESTSLGLCSALTSADRALECYDALLALNETRDCLDTDERRMAEAVATQLLDRLEQNAPPSTLLSPGPWLDTSIDPTAAAGGWTPQKEHLLRSQAARLKADSVQRRRTLEPAMCSYHDTENDSNVEEMEAAIAMQEVCIAMERRAELSLKAVEGTITQAELIELSQSEEREKSVKKHWIETQCTSETDL